MSKGGRLAISLGLFLVAVGLVVWAVAAYLTPGTPGGEVNFTNTQSAGQPVNLTVESVGSIGFGPHPSWVSYMTKDPHTGQWIQDNTWVLPANTQVNMTVYQFDSGSPLRNQQWGQVEGTTNNSATVNGASFTHFDSRTGAGVGHTFAIPSIGLVVPLPGVASSNICGAGPCLPSKWAHNTVTFSFKPPGPGSYNWQCFVPCGLGYLFGNGGGMSQENYMGGFLDVVR